MLPFNLKRPLCFHYTIEHYMIVFIELSYYYLKLFNKTVKILNLVKNSFSDIIFKYF